MAESTSILVPPETESAACFAACDAAELARRYLAGLLPRAAQDGIREFMDRYGMRGVTVGSQRVHPMNPLHDQPCGVGHPENHAPGSSGEVG